MKKAISTYKCGSGVVLTNPHDEDIMLYYKNREMLKQNLIKNKDHSKDYHYCTVDKATRIFYGAYAYPYMELIEGEDLGLDKFEICDHEKEYATELLRYCGNITSNEYKGWYHAYLGYCALKNGNGKKFTKDQIEKAQEIHDNGISGKMRANIIDYLQKIVNN